VLLSFFSSFLCPSLCVFAGGGIRTYTVVCIEAGSGLPASKESLCVSEKPPSQATWSVWGRPQRGLPTAVVHDGRLAARGRVRMHLAETAVLTDGSPLIVAGASAPSLLLSFAVWSTNALSTGGTPATGPTAPPSGACAHNKTHFAHAPLARYAVPCHPRVQVLMHRFFSRSPFLFVCC
jgi:hypothetical protein